MAVDRPAKARPENVTVSILLFHRIDKISIERHPQLIFLKIAPLAP
jgi:hypothetical protein